MVSRTKPEWPQIFGYFGMFVASAIGGSTIVLAVYAKAVSVEALANIAVAVGTFVLAFFTWRSTDETSQIIAADERRHQQGFVPIVRVLAAVYVDAGVQRLFVHGVNCGAGAALDISFHFTGEALLLFNYQGKQPVLGLSGISEKQEKITVPIDDDFDLPLLASGDENLPMFSTKRVGPLYDMVQSNAIITYAGIQSFHCESAVLNYTDLFGNAYRLEYTDFANMQFNFVIPERLKAPKF
jgi:hypothetical protein